MIDISFMFVFWNMIAAFLIAGVVCAACPKPSDSLAGYIVVQTAAHFAPAYYMYYALTHFL